MTGIHRPKRSTPSLARPVLCLLVVLVAGCSGPREEGDPAGGPGSGSVAASDGLPVAGGSANAGDEGIGGSIYRKACYACHQGGLVGAPRLGDRAAWEPRIARGVETLVDHALNGFKGDSGVMPPKGGHVYLSNEEITAAVEHMMRAVR